jgi:hypothetical protein
MGFGLRMRGAMPIPIPLNPDKAMHLVEALFDEKPSGSTPRTA